MKHSLNKNLLIILCYVVVIIITSNILFAEEQATPRRDSDGTEIRKARPVEEPQPNDYQQHQQEMNKYYVAPNGFDYAGLIFGSEALASGQGFFADLIYSDEQKSQGRQEALNRLHKMFGGDMPGTTSWWTNHVCSSKIPKSTNGYAYIDYRGKIEVIASVAGERQEYMQYNETNGTISSKQMYLYKLGFKVSNFDNQNRTIDFNVYVDTKPLYKNTISLGDGESFSRLGSSMVFKSSTTKYNTICIKFLGRPIQTRSGSEYQDTSEICNDIKPSSTIATTYHIPEYIENRKDATSPNPASSAQLSNI